MKSRTGPIRPRSAKPPMASTTVIHANMHWSDDQGCQVRLCMRSATASCLLTKREKQGRDSAGTDGGSLQHALQAEVLQVSDECRRSIREGQTVSPEEPLETAENCVQRGPLFEMTLNQLTFQQRCPPVRDAALIVRSSDAASPSTSGRHRES